MFTAKESFVQFRQPTFVRNWRAFKQISNRTFHIAWRTWIKFGIEYHQVIRRMILRFVKTSTIGVLLLDDLKYFSTIFFTSFLWFRYNSVLWYAHKNFLVISFLKVDAGKITWLIAVNKFVSILATFIFNVEFTH